jgi:uncharacterized Zn-finger protein
MNTEYTHNLICPYCGHENKDSWEVNMDEGMEWDDDIECGSCDETYRASRHCTITYSTAQKEGV